MPPDPLDAVTHWIVARGIAHVMTSGEPLRAICGRDRWFKAAVTAELLEPRKICMLCRRMYEMFPNRRPRLRDVQPGYDRQLAFGADWAKNRGDP
jgi:hypothetical protein